MENLGDNLPLTIDLDESEEVGVVGTRGISFHIDADHGGSLSDGENIVAGLNGRGATTVTDECVKVIDGTGKHVGLGRADKAVHDGVLVECLGNNIGATSAQALCVLVGSLNHGIVLGGRNGLDVGSHFLDSEVRERSVATLERLTNDLEKWKRL